MMASGSDMYKQYAGDGGGRSKCVDRSDGRSEEGLRGRTGATIDVMLNLSLYTTENIIHHLKDLFTQGDSDNDGVLSPPEFAAIMKSSGFNFTSEVIVELIKKADVNSDGVISFDEFVNLMMSVLGAAQDGRLGNADSPKKKAIDASKLDDAVLEKYLRRLFTIADQNGDGVLEPVELVRLLDMCGLDISHDEILALFESADTNKDGVILYEEFLPKALQIIKGSVKETFAVVGRKSSKPEKQKKAKAAAAVVPAAQSTMPNLGEVPPEMLERYLTKLFQVGDINGDGVLSYGEMAALLERSGFNLTPNQISDLVTASDTDGDRVISYQEFISVAMAMLQASGALEPASPKRAAREPDAALMARLANAEREAAVAKAQLRAIRATGPPPRVSSARPPSKRTPWGNSGAATHTQASTVAMCPLTGGHMGAPVRQQLVATKRDASPLARALHSDAAPSASLPNIFSEARYRTQVVFANGGFPPPGPALCERARDISPAKRVARPGTIR